MPSVRVRDNEHPEAALRRFKRICEKSGLLKVVNQKKAREKPTSMRKRKAAAAIKRHQKRLIRELPQRADRRGRAASAKTTGNRASRSDHA